MIGVIFLLCVAVAWIIFAVVMDLRSTEIPDWLNFSLVIFVLGFRFFYSLFSSQSFGFFYQGLIGLGIFFVLGNLLYYSHVFAGGDAKLMMALGVILPFSTNFLVNVKVFISFLFLFLAVGSIYGLAMSIFLAAKNFKNFKTELRKRHKEFLKFCLPINILGIVIMVFGFYNNLLFYLGTLIFVMPILYVCTKAVDEACMIKRRKPEQLMEGDWLYKDVKIGSKIIKSNWDGLSKDDIKLLKEKSKVVMIRTGIAFAPVFLVSFLVLIYFYFVNHGLFASLWNSIW